MTGKKNKPGPKPVEAIVHSDKRANLPTSNAHEFVDPAVEAPIPVRYPRDTTLDPQLVWKGKDQLDGQDLVADAPPIYIQEKMIPKALIENLRTTAGRPEDEPELTLFETFDGLSELDRVEYYRHEANWSNRMILGDSLNVMASLAEREGLRGKVQMIYIDPPYGVKFGSNWQPSIRSRAVKDGQVADASREVEQIKAFRDTWELHIHSYLAYLRDRLAIAHDLLTDSGSLFVQMGDDNVHLVRALLDEVFGSDNFLNQIAVRKTTGVQSSHVAATLDYLLVYGKDAAATKYRQLFVDKTAEASDRYDQVQLLDGTTRAITPDEKEGPQALPEGARRFQLDNLTSEGAPSDPKEREWTVDGHTYQLKGNLHWKTHSSGRDSLVLASRVQRTSRGGLRYRRFLDDFPVQEITNLWSDLSGAEQSRSEGKWYVVQTSVSLLERCILMATDPGDLVLDPTCGSGTAAYAAERWGRRWITIDTSRVALALARQRLAGAGYPYFLLADSEEGRAAESKLASSPLPTSVPRGEIREGFVYERVPHVTLKSIANNPDIKEGMTAAEIREAIDRYAEFELLYDKPIPDKNRVRVSGPFTVESLSPHRSLAFAGSAVDRDGAVNVEFDNEPSDGGTEFEQTILANLRTAGIQNGRRNERLAFDSLVAYASPFINAVGERQEVGNGTPRRVGITIGPQYGTVGPGFIKDAAREANRADDIDLLAVLGFAFDPAVLGKTDEYVTSEDGFANVEAERKLGRVPVLLVRMNADLVMGEELKKTGAGNLFTVFGEPDIEIQNDGDDLRVVLHGVDVYDPNTGDIRSNDTSQIALWMIDTAYNEESFFVRHCYFTGGQDPFKRLKSALKADIDREAWESLYRTESRPFPRPDTGKIAVKVINDYGDEVVKVFAV